MLFRKRYKVRKTEIFYFVKLPYPKCIQRIYQKAMTVSIEEIIVVILENV